MKRRPFVLVAIVLAFALVAAACGDDDSGATTTTAAPATTTTTAAPTTTTTTAAPTTTTTGEPVVLTVWADDKKAPVLEELAPAVLEQTGVTLQVTQFNFDDLREQVAQAAPAGEGPDIFVGAHDWTGQFAADGIAAPVDLGGRDGEFVDSALVAFNYAGDLYAVPYSVEAIALFYNTELSPAAPATFDELLATCDGLAADIDNCFGLAGGADDVGAAAYHHYPWVSVFGGYIFQFDLASGYDPSVVGLDSEESIAGMTYLEGLITDGYMGNVTQDDAVTQFTTGKAPFFLSGSWQLNNLNESGIPYALTTIPTIEGSTASPFVGANGFFINSFSENVGVAQTFLLDFVATPEFMAAIYEADPRNPAYVATAEQVLAGDEIALAFAASAATGQPMPNIPEMGSVWGPMSDQINGMRNGNVDATTAMTTAAEQVRAAVGG